MVWPAVIGGAALLGAAALSSNSAKSSQKRSIEAQKEIAQNQYTWAVEDLDRAGLNPILAAQGGISGASASAPPAPVAVGTQLDFAGSAKDITQAILNQQKSKNVVQDTLLKLKQTEHEGERIALTSQAARELHSRMAVNRSKAINLIAQVNEMSVNIDRMESQIKVQHADRERINQETVRLEQAKELLIAQYRMLAAQLPAAQKAGKVYSTWYGTFLSYVKETLAALGINTGVIMPLPVGKGGSSRVKGFGR